MPGHDTDIFVSQPVDKSYICAICMEVYHIAVSVCGEGHTFCQSCIYSVERCPTCRSPIQHVHKVRTLNDAISNLQVNCKEEGCLWTGPLSQKDNHSPGNCTIANLRKRITVLEHEISAETCQKKKLELELSEEKSKAIHQKEELLRKEKEAREDASAARSRFKAVTNQLLALWKRFDIRNVDSTTGTGKGDVGRVLSDKSDVGPPLEDVVLRIKPDMPWNELYDEIMGRAPESFETLRDEQTKEILLQSSAVEVLNLFANPKNKLLLLHKNYGCIQVFVKALSGKTLTLMVHRWATVGELKKVMSKKSGIPRDELHLYYAGKWLDGDRMLRDYNVQREATLHQVKRWSSRSCH